MPVDTSSAVDLKINHHLSYDQIGKLQGVSPQAIHQKIKHLLPTPDTKTYQDSRADILSHLQLELLKQIDPARLKKISVRDAVVSAGILYDKERLERGQSTDIVSYQDLNRTYAQVRAERAKLERELGITELELSTAPEMGDDTGNQLI